MRTVSPPMSHPPALAEQQPITRRIAAQLEEERDCLAQCARMLTSERAAVREQLAEMHDRAARAIRQAEQLASDALRRAREELCVLQLEREPARNEPQQLETNVEERLRGELDATKRQRDELLARVQRLDLEQRKLELELESERKLADDAALWASRAERALVAAAPAASVPEPSSPESVSLASRRRRGPRVRVRHGE